MLNFVWALCAVKYQGPLQYTLSALAKNSTFSVHNGEKSDMKNALYVRRGHFTAVSEGTSPMMIISVLSGEVANKSTFFAILCILEMGQSLRNYKPCFLPSGAFQARE